MPIIEPRMLGLLPDGVDKATFFVADKSNVERRIFDTDGELYTPDGQTVDDRLNAVEAGIPPLDDARIVALEGAMLTAQGDIIVAEADIATAEGDIDSLEVTVGAEQLLLDQAQTDITNLQGEMVTAQADIVTADGKAVSAQSDVDSHIADLANPHVVTRAQIGAEASGTAASAIVTHVSLDDPHAQYLKESPLATEVDALPLSDANNVFTGSTIADQLQQAGVQLAQYASNIVLKNATNPDWTAQMAVYEDGTPKGFTVSGEYNDDYVQIIEAFTGAVDFSDKDLNSRMYWFGDGETTIFETGQHHGIGADSTGPYYIKNNVKTYF